jgi:transcription elongation GreA/GreB family factor
MTEKEFITAEGLALINNKIEELEQKLKDLRLYKGEEAVHAGDSWHDNPTLYRVEAEERTMMVQISDLKDKLKRAVVIDTPHDTDQVSIGCKVEVKFSDGSIETYKVLSEAEANPRTGIISYKSPLGATLLGKRVGEKVKYSVNSITEEVVIISISL